jgi:hypothetical protein
LPDPITEDKVKITLTWKASSRTRQALERQAKLNQFGNVTEFLVNRFADQETGNAELFLGRL